MNVLVYPHSLSIGGSQINAIDLAAAVAGAGHGAAVYGIEGPLVERIRRQGLRFFPARRLRYRPAPSRIAQLWSLARQEGFDLIHAYEWPPCLDAYFGAHLVGGVPLVCTVLSMSVSPLVPDSVPLVMGTEALGAEARHRRPDVSVIEPPVDLAADHPGIDGRAFRVANDVEDGQLLLVTVSRLSSELKLDALIAAIDATGILAARHPIRLVVVGDGEARPWLAERAEAVNGRWGREVVSLAGAMADPRPAYAAADVVLGMGGSALRAAAIGRPLVVQGRGGFSLPLRPDTVDTFVWQGFWGEGDGSGGAASLAEQIDPLLDDASLRSEMGDFGRHLVEQRFSLDRACELALEVYGDAIAHRARPPLREVAGMAGRAVHQEIEQHRPSVKRTRAAEEAARLERPNA
jgi:L-malate glycosyltransferase